MRTAILLLTAALTVVFVLLFLFNGMTYFSQLAEGEHTYNEWYHLFGNPGWASVASFVLACVSFTAYLFIKSAGPGIQKKSKLPGIIQSQ